MRVLTDEDVRRFVDEALAFDAVSAAFRAVADGSAHICPVVHGDAGANGEVFSIKSGSQPSRGLAGLKIGTYWPQNAARGLSNHGATTLLLDPTTGALQAVIEATTLNRFRTAAANAVAVDALARADSRTLGVLGAGQQALHEIRAVVRVRPIDTILIWSRRTEQASALAHAAVGYAEDVRLAAVEEVVGAADILTTVTKSDAPLFPADRVGSGVHISAMGADRPGKQELPAALAERADLFADDPEQARRIGEFQHLGETARITAIGDVLSGRAPGRRTEESVTVFDSSGVAAQDLFVAEAVVKRMG